MSLVASTNQAQRTGFPSGQKAVAGSATTQPCAETPSPEAGESCGMRPLAACQDFRKAQQAQSSSETLFAFSDDQQVLGRPCLWKPPQLEGLEAPLIFGIIQKQRKVKAPDINHSSFYGPLVIMPGGGAGDNFPNLPTAWKMKIFQTDP